MNQIQSPYNDFGQLTAQYQTHGGAVNSSATPDIEYTYANGTANTIRSTSITDPEGRVFSYSYGTTDAASRIAALVEGNVAETHLGEEQKIAASP